MPSAKFVSKTLKLHTERDKRIIDFLDKLPENKSISCVIKDIIYSYFDNFQVTNDTEIDLMDIYKGLKSLETSMKNVENTDLMSKIAGLESHIKNIKFQSISSPSSAPYIPPKEVANNIERSSKSIADLMNSSMAEGDDNIDLGF